MIQAEFVYKVGWTLHFTDGLGCNGLCTWEPHVG